MTPAEIAALFDIELDPRACPIEEPPAPNHKRASYIRYKRLAERRGYDPGWPDKTFLEVFGHPYSSFCS